MSDSISAYYARLDEYHALCIKYKELPSGDVGGSQHQKLEALEAGFKTAEEHREHLKKQSAINAERFRVESEVFRRRRVEGRKWIEKRLKALGVRYSIEGPLEGHGISIHFLDCDRIGRKGKS